MEQSVFAGSDDINTKFEKKFKLREAKWKKVCGDTSWKQGKRKEKKREEKSKRAIEDINRISNLKTQARSTTRIINHTGRLY